jgi:hypothetical protein
MVSNPKFLSGAALLRDGRVLVVGDAAVELYDPNSGTFTLTDGRGIFGPAILLQDGTVFAGDDTAALRFDPVTDSFTMLRAGSVFTSYNADPATALANGQFYSLEEEATRMASIRFRGQRCLIRLPASFSGRVTSDLLALSIRLPC